MVTLGDLAVILSRFVKFKSKDSFNGVNHNYLIMVNRSDNRQAGIEDFYFTKLNVIANS